MEHNTFVGRLLNVPDLQPQWAGCELQIEPLWPTRSDVPVRVRCDRDLGRHVRANFSRGSLLCVTGQRWVHDPAGPVGQRFHLRASYVTGLRPATTPEAPNPAGSQHVPAGWTRIVATGTILGDRLTIRTTTDGTDVGEFTISGRRAPGPALLVVRAPLAASESLRCSDLVRVTGTVAMDHEPDGATDDQSFHLAGDQVEVLATTISSNRLRPLVEREHLATVHQLRRPSPGVSL